MSVEKRDMATAKGAVPPTDDEISRVFKNRLRALRKKVSLNFCASRDRGQSRPSVQKRRNDQRRDIADDGIGSDRTRTSVCSFLFRRVSCVLAGPQRGRDRKKGEGGKVDQ